MVSDLYFSLLHNYHIGKIKGAIAQTPESQISLSAEQHSHTFKEGATDYNFKVIPDTSDESLDT